MSRRHLAESAGVSHSVVIRLERGGDGRLSTWMRLFEAMGCLAVLEVVGSDPSAEDLIVDERDRKFGRQHDGLEHGHDPYLRRPRRRRAGWWL